MPATAGTPSNSGDGSNNRGARNRREACMKVFNRRESVNKQTQGLLIVNTNISNSSVDHRVLCGVDSRSHVPWIYRPSYRENKPKSLVFNNWKRAFWTYFRENCVYKFGNELINYSIHQSICLLFLKIDLLENFTALIYHKADDSVCCRETSSLAISSES